MTVLHIYSIPHALLMLLTLLTQRGGVYVLFKSGACDHLDRVQQGHAVWVLKLTGYSVSPSFFVSQHVCPGNPATTLGGSPGHKERAYVSVQAHSQRESTARHVSTRTFMWSQPESSIRGSRHSPIAPCWNVNKLTEIPGDNKSLLFFVWFGLGFFFLAVLGSQQN